MIVIYIYIDLIPSKNPPAPPLHERFSSFFPRPKYKRNEEEEKKMKMTTETVTKSTSHASLSPFASNVVHQATKHLLLKLLLENDGEGEGIEFVSVALVEFVLVLDPVQAQCVQEG